MVRSATIKSDIALAWVVPMGAWAANRIKVRTLIFLSSDLTEQFLTMDDIDSCIYENVTRCLASSISNSNFNSLQVGSYRTDLDIEIPSHYDVPASHYDVPNRLQFRSHSLTALNMLTTHHQLNIGSRAESSSPLSDRSVEFQSLSVPGSPEAAKYRHAQHCNASTDMDMSSRDKAIYNSLGSSSSKAGKVCLPA